MAAPKLPSASTALHQDIQAFDATFAAILQDLQQVMIESTARNTERVMKLASEYMNRSAYDALQQFHGLYVSRNSMERKKEEINRNVDDLFDTIQSKVAAGESTDNIIRSTVEDDASKQDRLGLAGLQKQLEGLITLNEGIKAKVLPALNTMQFEDAMTQRLEHIINGFQKVLANLAAPNPEAWRSVAEAMAATTTSVDETACFYRIVLKEEPPAGGASEDILFF